MTLALETTRLSRAKPARRAVSSRRSSWAGAPRPALRRWLAAPRWSPSAKGECGVGRADGGGCDTAQRTKVEPSCGGDAYHDTARVLAEDHSPCASQRVTYCRSDLVTGFTFDTLPSELAVARRVLDTHPPGKLVVVTDRAAQTVSAVDHRGRAIAAARRIAKPGLPHSDPELRFTPRWYLQTATFDAADRPIAQTTGAAVSELLGAGGVSSEAFTVEQQSAERNATVSDGK